VIRTISSLISPLTAAYLYGTALRYAVRCASRSEPEGRDRPLAAVAAGSFRALLGLAPREAGLGERCLTALGMVRPLWLVKLVDVMDKDKD
jgi:hypothetical protein